ncbi:MAG: hypothetical protein SVM80_10000 [Halobacteriota archaeon]|nr:hypothetical protein [Halobacteriota archaeon]
MKPNQLSPEWKKKKEKIAEELKNRGELYFKIKKIEFKKTDR